VWGNSGVFLQSLVVVVVVVVVVVAGRRVFGYRDEDGSKMWLRGWNSRSTTLHNMTELETRPKMGDRLGRYR